MNDRDSQFASSRDAGNTISETVSLLLPETVETLAALAEAPMYIANATIGAMPFGSRAALEDLGIVNNHCLLTPFGCDVIDYVAQLKN